jgi:hypothetical protein
MKIKITIAVLLTIVALSFRLLLALRFPNDWPGDAVTYALLAKNTRHHQIYSSDTEEPLQPTYFRVPGYPLFLLAVYSAFGDDNNRAVRIIQTILDTVTCWLIALLVFQWSPAGWEIEKRRRALLIALALAATCPFTAIYVAVVLTEVWANLFITLCALAATCALQAAGRKRIVSWWLVAGLAAGAATMFRPDAGLFAAGVGATIGLLGLTASYQKWRHENRARAPVSSNAMQDRQAENSAPLGHHQTPTSAQSGDGKLALTVKQRLAQMILSGVIFSAGFALVLAPWAIRNARVFGVFQPIAPASASMPGEWIPQGYNAWLRTWVDRESFTETVDWPLDQRHITIEQMPDYAFDSPAEKAQVAALLDQYNNPPQAKTQQAADTDNGKGQEEISADDEENSSTDEDNGDEDSSDEGDGADDDAGAEEPAIVKMTPEIDAGFAQIARSRIANHPFRYYVITPLRRARYLWFSTHSGYYPFSGELTDKFDKERHQEFWLPCFMSLLWLYTILGAGGVIVLWREEGLRRWLLLVVLLVLPRLAYLATLQNPEPRYTVEFFPFVLALAALAAAAIRLWRPKEVRSVS